MGWGIVLRQRAPAAQEAPLSARSFLRDVFAAPTRDEGAERYDTDAPWICWRFLTTDARTRITGRMVVLMDCCVCGETRKLRLKIPRVGDTTTQGKHPARAQFILDHLHPDKGHPMSWAKPLRNPFGISGSIDLDLLAMRLQADLQEAARDA